MRRQWKSETELAYGTGPVGDLGSRYVWFRDCIGKPGVTVTASLFVDLNRRQIRELAEWLLAAADRQDEEA